MSKSVSRALFSDSQTSLSSRELAGYNTSRARKINPNRALSAGDQYGHAIAIWEDFALISATGRNSIDNPHNNFDGGMVFQFRLINGVWKQQNSVLTSGVLSDAYGESLAMCEGVAIVGAWKDSTFGTYSGKAYTYKYVRSGSGLSLVAGQVLTLDGAAAGDFFGFSVAVVPQFSSYMKGAAIVGAFGYNKNNNIVDSGAAVVFARVGESWLQVAVLEASDGASFDSFGWSISAHDNVLAVGAPEAGSAQSQGGAVYLYVFNKEVIVARKLQGEPGGPDEPGEHGDPNDPAHQQQGQHPQAESQSVAWEYVEVAKFTSGSTGASNGMFGVDVSVRNDSQALTVAIGACLDNDRGYHTGAVYVYSRTNTIDLAKKYVWDRNQKQGNNKHRALRDNTVNSDFDKVDMVSGLRTRIVSKSSPSSDQIPTEEHHQQGRSLQEDWGRGWGQDYRNEDQDWGEQDRKAQEEKEREEQQREEDEKRRQEEEANQPQTGHYAVDADDLKVDKTGRYWVRDGALYGTVDLMRFGRSIALSKGGLLVGADMSGLSPGRAFVFSRQRSSRDTTTSSIVSGPLQNASWVRVATLHNLYGSKGDFFGASCDIFGGSVIIGAYMNSASDSKLSNSNDASSNLFPGAAFAFFTNDVAWVMASVEQGTTLFSSSTIIATFGLTIALLVVMVAVVYVHRKLKAQKEGTETGYRQTSDMDTTGRNSSTSIDVSNRSSDPLSPSLGGSSGLHLTNFRKKRNKVSSLSGPHGGPLPPGPFIPGSGATAADPYHSPNLLEEHGLAQPSTSMSRTGHGSPYVTRPISSHGSANNFAGLGDSIGTPSHLSRSNKPHGISTRQSPSSLSGSGMGGHLDGKRRSTLTRKGTGGAMELNPPHDF
eukprot:CAMPEP_0182424090 /NCGR_PEP_ID=MMETSP1167-20130531/10242_1 /TAXON_ID=2988 /ORGANISM="Mallomonas Sp, Strain CCMP3275" /LENGTH=877 /DNA_ID=CAMNT_0024603633 /DNA_START=270 /DNA_END=2903 /DNA_ORIENTATION=+